jgi:hypothetical protein
MGCLFVLFAVLLPRVVMVFVFLLTSWFSQAYHTVIWPVLGFIFMPYTTLAYMVAMLENHHQLTGGWIVLIIVAVVLDLGGLGGSARWSGRS